TDDDGAARSHVASSVVDLDLAIIGGGPAGIATALFFAAASPGRAPHVAVLEKERYPREKICAGAIGARADRLLQTVGVRVGVPPAHVRGLSVATARGALAARDPDAIRPVGRVVRRVEFDHALAERARARGVRLIEESRVTELVFEPGGVLVRTA